MSPVKERLTVTVNPQFVEAGNEAVAEGRAESLSAWVNLALAERTAKERRLKALGNAVASFEAQFGVITAEELEAQRRADSAAARVARGGTRRRAKTGRGRSGAA
jgi:Arc/MetJ-type ribon-helix-helix transcriptional regulator